MPRSIEKLKKIRSLDEIVTRGGQAISIYKEQHLGQPRIPSDEEMVKLVDRSHFGTGPVIAESLWQKLYQNSEKHFFTTFKDRSALRSHFERIYGSEASNSIISRADRVTDGRIDLLGLKNLHIGTQIDWHREPLSAKRSPIKHWKEFDEIDSGETGDRKLLWELNRHQHFFTLGAAYLLSGDERYAEVFVEHISSWIDQNPPGLGINWASSLEVSFRAISWVWALNFFRDSDHFTPTLLMKILKYLHLHGSHIEKYLSTYFSPNTHLTGEALGLYYLGTQLPFFERSALWRKRGDQILLAEAEKQIHPDGVYFEQSTWYQRYTHDFYTHFLILRSFWQGIPLSNGKASLEERLEKGFEFLINIQMPDGTTPLIGDDDGGRALPLTTTEPDDFRGLISVGAVVLDLPGLKYHSREPGEELFWLMGESGVAAFEKIEPDEPQTESVEFPVGGYCVMRDGWSETDSSMIIDCGEVGSFAGGHGHADALSIVAALNGKPLLVDSGTYTYHESKQLRDYFRSTTAHNSLEIDQRSSSEPGGTFAWKTRAETIRHQWIQEETFDFFQGSHNGYERLADPARHTREILFLKGDYWIMRDVVEAQDEHEYSLNFHFARGRKPSVSPDAASIGDDDHRIFAFGDGGVWKQSESWISNNHANKTNSSFMRFESRAFGKCEFFTFIIPNAVDGSPARVAEHDMPFGRAFSISHLGYTDLFIYNDESGRQIDNGVFASNFEYSWARLGNGEPLPDEFVFINGDRLSMANNECIEGRRLTHASGRRFGRELYLKSEAGRTKVDLAGR